jgi:hypothetical protein
MKAEELLEEINYWNSELSTGSENLYEYAFFKVFVKFERYMSQRFIEYATGLKTKNDIELARKLKFNNKEHINVFLKSPNSSFVNYLERIQSTSKYIFEDEKNPFSLIFEDAQIKERFDKMKCLRNYIAHESDESKHKYHKHVLTSASSFQEPNEFLKEIKRGKQKTNYTILIEDLREMIKRIEEPELYFAE